MEDFISILKYLISPFYLLPAVLGLLFFAKTKDKPLIDRKIYYQFMKPDRTIHFPMETKSFWGKDKNIFGLFLVPGVNIFMLVGALILYYRERKATSMYFQYNRYKENDADRERL